MFKNPQSTVSSKNKINFSEFLTEVDNGRVVKVEIKGNNIIGELSDGNVFTTYAPNDPNLIEKLSSKGVSISAAPLDEKNAIIIWSFTILVPDAFINCSLDISYETNARWKRWGDGFWQIKS